VVKRIVVALVFFGGTACAQDNEPLIERINAYRSSPQKCQGKQTGAAGPLAPASSLDRVEIGSQREPLQDALKRAGYTASRAQAIVLSGPATAGSAMGMLRERYCDVLMSPQFSEIGISRQGTMWRIVLAQPLLSADLGGWREAGAQVLKLVNEARSAPRTCGEQRFGRAPPLSPDSKLAAAALAHSRDMATGNYFAHAAKDGSVVGDRAARAGYQWRLIGENIATGQGSPKQVVAGWLASPYHCVNIMQPGFTEMGTAYFVNPQSSSVIYWTQVFGAPQR
jgi:uncharacterized protein YkwD